MSTWIRPESLSRKSLLSEECDYIATQNPKFNASTPHIIVVTRNPEFICCSTHYHLVPQTRQPSNA